MERNYNKSTDAMRREPRRKSAVWSHDFKSPDMWVSGAAGWAFCRRLADHLWYWRYLLLRCHFALNLQSIQSIMGGKQAYN